VSLPAADDLFRPTAAPAQDENADADDTDPESSVQEETGAAWNDHGRPRPARRPSGRVRHDEKMTVYVTADELLELEHARLLLRRDHDLAIDRGRLVREAVALALADLDARGEDSVIVQRLKQA
jgi:hypothetical protein